MKAPKFWKKAVFWIAFSLAAGGVSTWLTKDGLQRFEQIAKPALTPPRIVFPVAWSILLVLVGLGFALILEKTAGTPDADSTAAVFGVQMTFFFCWMIWFFGLGWFGFAAIWLIGMIASIILMISVYRNYSAAAAWMQMPYLLWCCFALYLNIGVWLLNR